MEKDVKLTHGSMPSVDWSSQACDRANERIKYVGVTELHSLASITY